MVMLRGMGYCMLAIKLPQGAIGGSFVYPSIRTIENQLCSCPCAFVFLCFVCVRLRTCAHICCVCACYSGLFSREGSYNVSTLSAFVHPISSTLRTRVVAYERLHGKIPSVSW